MKTALIITAYKRPQLLSRCLDSVLAADLSSISTIIVHDDCSRDQQVQTIINGFIERVAVPVIFHKQPRNVGIKGALLHCFTAGFVQHEICINLDGDAIVKPNFVSVLLGLKQRFPDRIVSGFNCSNNPKNPLLHSGDGYVIRQHCNGINMVIDRTQFSKQIKPALTKGGNWDYNSTTGHNAAEVVISRPSVVQHIGAGASTMFHKGGDVASDFKLFALPQVALFGIDAHDPTGMLQAAEVCKRDIQFGAERIITERLFPASREAYSKWMIEDLYSHLPAGDYTHVLTIHPDGFIQNPQAWENKWLQYDYIGAPWHFYTDENVVGNGGFSLRSVKLIELCSRLDLQNYHPEDHVICRELRPWLEIEYGIKFAPYEVAVHFSIEAYAVPAPQNRYVAQFGFHGYSVQGLPIPPAPKQPAVTAQPRRIR